MLDKTGTLTEGRPAVTDIIPYAIDEQHLLRLVAAAQTGSEHVLARAILAKAAGIELPALEDFRSRTGMGIVARVGGQRITVGNRRLMAEENVGIAALGATAEKLEGQGRTVMWVAALEPAPQLLGIIAVADPVKPTA